MVLTILIISAIICAAVFYGDIDSSMQFDDYTDVWETKTMFKDAHGDTNVRKLLVFKGALFAATLVGAYFCYRSTTGGRNLSFIVFWAMFAVEFLVVRNNYKLIKKAKARRVAAATAKETKDEQMITAVETDNGKMD